MAASSSSSFHSLPATSAGSSSLPGGMDPISLLDIKPLKSALKSKSSSPEVRTSFREIPIAIRLKILKAFEETFQDVNKYLADRRVPLFSKTNFYANEDEVMEGIERTYDKIITESKESVFGAPSSGPKLSFAEGEPIEHIVPSKAAGRGDRKGLSRTQSKPSIGGLWNDMASRVNNGSHDSPFVQHDGDPDQAEANSYSDPGLEHTIASGHMAIQGRYNLKHKAATDLFEDLVVKKMRGEPFEKARMKRVFVPWARTVHTPKIPGSSRSGWELSTPWS